MKKTLLTLALLASCVLAFANNTGHHGPKTPPDIKTPPTKPDTSGPKSTPSTPRATQSRTDTVDRPCDKPEPPVWCKWVK